MSRFPEAVEVILKHEGGYVDHPSDPGGRTNFGISQRAYPNIDIKNLTRDAAKAIYKRDYWDVCKCDEFPWPLSLFVFDAGVNQGTGRALRLLQRTVGVKEDGNIGPVTRAAIAKYQDVGAHYMATRAIAYSELASFAIFGRGWMRRIFTILSDAK
jgi:lysozyme family protein